MLYSTLVVISNKEQYAKTVLLLMAIVTEKYIENFGDLKKKKKEMGQKLTLPFLSSSTRNGSAELAFSGKGLEHLCNWLFSLNNIIYCFDIEYS